VRTYPFSALTLPALPAKPRRTAVTAVLDKGASPRELADLVAVAGDWIDVLKMGWGTARMQPVEIVREKVAVLAAADVRACTGGTFLEVALAQDRVDECLDEAARLGFPMVEVSNGVHPMSAEQKLALIGRARERGFRVLSEVGKKDAESDAQLTLMERVSAVQAELAAGSEKVILEARESGTMGIFDRNGKPLEELIHRIVEQVGVESILFEAPRKEQQVWLIRQFGPAVNLANIPPADALSVATLRTGLRADTFRDFQMPGVPVFLELGVNGALQARQRGGVVVMIDALRASATIVTALSMGMAAVVPAVSVEQCRGDVTAGERGGRKLPTLDHGNSPTELLAQGARYAGKTLGLTTTNGIDCLTTASCPATLVLVGTTINARAVAARALAMARERGAPITLLMAGRNNQPCLEDELAAAEILGRLGPAVRVQGAVPRRSNALEADFFAGDSGRNLAGLGYSDDVRFCAELDTFDAVPVFRDGVLTLSPGNGA
jgi:phosphosulfolactate synthase (CoM biosynthesis protein A)/phosphosulfolactate phosphohydrolase-like enzyme